MPGTPTTRLSLPTIDGSTDAVSSYPAVNSSQMEILDNAAIYDEGTLVSRTAGEHGQFYRTTDAGAETFAWTDGTLWLPLGLIPSSKSSNASAVSGQAIITTGSGAITITLPSHVAGQKVAVVNMTSNVTTVSGSSIQGAGLSSAASFPLGTVGASATLLDDGTNWNMIAGQQDGGWQPLPEGAFAPAPGYGAPFIRLFGNQVLLKGSLQNVQGLTDNLSVTLAVAFRPAATVQPGNGLLLTSAGHLTGPSIGSGDIQALDNASYFLN